ncbi:hypothetical protein ACHAXR_003729 [Thalassiosira sp. AJA248-18]
MSLHEYEITFEKAQLDTMSWLPGVVTQTQKDFDELKTHEGERLEEPKLLIPNEEARGLTKSLGKLLYGNTNDGDDEKDAEAGEDTEEPSSEDEVDTEVPTGEVLTKKIQEDQAQDDALQELLNGMDEVPTGEVSTKKIQEDQAQDDALQELLNGMDEDDLDDVEKQDPAHGVEHATEADPADGAFILFCSQTVETSDLSDDSANSGAEILSQSSHMKMQFVYLVMMLFVMPFAALFFAPLSVISAVFWVGYASMLIITVTLLLELASSVISWREARRLHAQPVSPDLSKNVMAIVSAYLPNEIDILQDTLNAMIRCKLPNASRFVVLISHNGGSEEQVERLRQIIQDLPQYPNVTVMEKDNLDSRSKAENVNGALDFIKEWAVIPEIVVLYDADHQPEERAVIHALQTLEAKNADVLQGRCIINRGTTIIAAEFDTIYGINHPGGAVLHGFAFFGGTNGFWRFETLDKIRMDTSMLTEDVDSAFRALEEGHKVVYDPMVVSFEEAPPGLNALIKQRLRWTQGWSQVAVRHLPLIWKRDFSLRRKVMIFFLLHYREVYFYLSSLTLPGVFCYAYREKEIITSYFMLVIGVAPLMLPVTFSLITRLQAGSDLCHPDLGAKQYIKYMLISPVYEVLKVLIAVLGHYRNLTGLTKWEITSRNK